ncbi:VWA domain-containing protein [Agrobacterium vitis]|uniref:VWA domain-containing protein n=1 Tax=Rhizobium/Agrobacterium group TaxID=227290 RepID=UPI0008DC13C0|nr:MULTISPECIES: VWA domain-containing protein [Rhizobium/Agrobacterium group]MCF1436570.1 VWA domain-containing protein [Allorhizobium ampelinum]MUO91676.1 VWA domain-containing protein [Agrobacterium vitis]MUZ55238.1 VWA domain-containing protein [Agrobacterium vitis]MUZ94490.1 VWA domain-containing protein [Agrobacterium vitis]MVA42809.1 VWA domain-containing protein [Agrobacterium vitis]
MSQAAALDPLTRWRLILGEASDAACSAAGCTMSGDAMAMDAALDWLYGRDDEDGARNISRQGGRGPSALTTPQWINDIHRLFPKETIERLERDAIEHYAIDDIVTNPDVLSRAEPNETLLKAVLRTKHLMSPDILVMARKLVQEVVRQLMEKLSREMAVAFSGVVDRRRHSRFKIASDLDFRRVLKDNLKHYNAESRQLTVERLHFFARNRRHMKQWQVILLVDQSGSMLDSVIHSAVTAACLLGLPGVKTHLVAFDTSVVDLTSDVDDPCELLMKVQLGGGTDIQRAVGYAADLITQPENAIVILISDFYEGASEAMLLQRVAELTAQRTLVLGLAALDSDAEPAFDREMARRLVSAGAEVGAMTPGELAGWLAAKIGR